MSLSRVLMNLYISHTHVPPLTNGPMHRQFIHITIHKIHHNTQNASQYIKYITIHKIHHNTMHKVHHNIMNKVHHNIMQKIYHNISDTGR